MKKFYCWWWWHASTIGTYQNPFIPTTTYRLRDTIHTLSQEDRKIVLPKHISEFVTWDIHLFNVYLSRACKHYLNLVNASPIPTIWIYLKSSSSSCPYPYFLFGVGAACVLTYSSTIMRIKVIPNINIKLVTIHKYAKIIICW